MELCEKLWEEKFAFPLRYAIQRKVGLLLKRGVGLLTMSHLFRQVEMKADCQNRRRFVKETMMGRDDVSV